MRNLTIRFYLKNFNYGLVHTRDIYIRIYCALFTIVKYKMIRQNRKHGVCTQ